jgi:hypothetical protein
MGGMGGGEYCDQDDDMEEDEILKRELGENTNSVADSSQIKLEQRGTTADTSNITDQNRASSKKQPAKNGGLNSSKSVKQSNLADWVSSATKASTCKTMLNGAVSNT